MISCEFHLTSGASVVRYVSNEFRITSLELRIGSNGWEMINEGRAIVNNPLSISKIPIHRESIISGKCARLCAIGAEICEVLTTSCAKQSQFAKGLNERKLNSNRLL